VRSHFDCSLGQLLHLLCVLIVDGDPEAADTLGLLLEVTDPSLMALATYTAPGAVCLADEGSFDVVLITLQIGGYDETQVAQEIELKCSKNFPKLIALSSHTDQVDTAHVRSLFAYALKRPLAVEELLEAICSL
jgi:DNA-binding response OmpR family regulator